MKIKRAKRSIWAAVLAICLLLSGLWLYPGRAQAASADGWVGAWSTSPVEFNLKKSK